MSGTQADPSAGPTPQPSPTPGADPQAGEPWYTQRIGVLTAQRHDADRKRDEAERKATELQTQLTEATSKLNAATATLGGQATVVTPPSAPTGSGATYTQADLDRLADQKAGERIFAERCNELHAKGTKEFTDFVPTMENFRNVGGLPPSILEAALEIPDGHKVLHALGKDLNETTRIIGLGSPARQAAALATFANKLPQGQTQGQGQGGGQPTRRAPPEPIPTRVDGPTGSGGGVDLYGANVDSKTWFNERIKQKKAGGRSRR